MITTDTTPLTPEERAALEFILTPEQRVVVAAYRVECGDEAVDRALGRLRPKLVRMILAEIGSKLARSKPQNASLE